MVFPKNLSFYGRYAFRRQLPAEVFNTFGADTVLLGQFVLTRIFQPKPWETTLLFSLMHLSFFLSPWFAERMRGRSTTRLFHFMFLLAVLPLVGTAFTRGFWGVGPALVLANIAFVSLFVPLRNRLLRANYHDWERGRCYAAFKSTSAAVYFGCALWAAFELEANPQRIHVILPTAGILAGIGILIFSRIRERGQGKRIRGDDERRRRGFKDVYRDLFELYRTQRAFFLFQVGFFIYGMGFMFTMPREMDMVGSVLKLDYPLIVLGIYGVTPLVKMTCIRIFGNLLDRAGPCILSSVAFLLLVAYPLGVFLALQFASPILWLVARGAFGFAMAGVDVAWSVGPLSFGPREQAPRYTAAHIFAVGIRASIGPTLGHLVSLVAGSGVFLAAAGLLTGASLFMRRLARGAGAHLDGRKKGDREHNGAPGE